jgi:hypothetical protein
MDLYNNRVGLHLFETHGYSGIAPAQLVLEALRNEKFKRVLSASNKAKKAAGSVWLTA